MNTITNTEEQLLSKDKFESGHYNERLIAYNLNLSGHKVTVLNDNNPMYDLQMDDTIFIECKLDRMQSPNFYFEYYNYTYNRPTGIDSYDKDTYYCHTFRYNGKWCYIYNTRKIFIKTVKQIRNTYPDKIRCYNKTYTINNRTVGDKAFIIDKDTFLNCYVGEVYLIKFPESLNF